MTYDHFEPAVRARRHRRQLSRLPLFGGSDDDDDNDTGIRILGGGGGGGGLVPSVTTIIDSVPLFGTTLVHTQVATILVPAPQSSTTPPPASSTIPVSPPNTSAQPQPTSQSNTSSSSSETSSSSSAATESTSSSASQTSSSSAPSNTAASDSVTDAASATQAADESSPQTDSRHRSTQTLSTTVITSPSTSAGALGVGASTTNDPKLSGGAIGAIVAVSIIVGIAILLFVVRKVFLKKRQNRRDTWGAAVFPKGDFGDHHGQDMFEKPPMDSLNPPPLPEKPITPTSAVPMLAPPPMSYNNSPAPVTSPTLQPAAGSPAVALTPAGAGSMFAQVRCTFIPTLPDELSISMGESVRILNEYDDGWALCINNLNEQGVVPLECLERRGAPTKPGQYLGQGTGDWRMSRRASSLYAGQSQLRY